MPHLNNKQNKNTKPIISRQEYHFTQPCPSEEKQTNKQKLSTNLTLYETHLKPLEYKTNAKCQLGNKAMKRKLTNMLRGKERKERIYMQS